MRIEAENRKRKLEREENSNQWTGNFSQIGKKRKEKGGTHLLFKGYFTAQEVILLLVTG